MRFLSHRLGCWKSLLSAAILGLTATAAQAQPPAAPEALPTPPKPAAAAPATISPGYCQPCPGYTSPYLGYTPTPGGMPSTGMGAGTGTPDTGGGSSDFRGLTSGAGFSSSTAVGYIDPAIPMTQFRLRADAAFSDTVPDRAAFLYAKCGCFPGAPGPGPNPNAKVNYQEVSGYLEYAESERLSTFFTVPLRFIEQSSIPSPAHPGNNGDFGGISDLDFGFKYALLMDPCNVGTFQFRTYAPTGNPHEGLGNNLWVLEPAFLYFRQLSERWTLESEVRGWIPIRESDADDFAGNILRYGVGVGYLAYCGPKCWIKPVVEVVGWTILSGKELDLNAPNSERSAKGDTIVNLKLGVRIGVGQHSDVYMGYGQALTSENYWYNDVYRLEYRLRF